MSSKTERMAWTKFIERRKREKKAKRPRARKKPQPSQAKLEAALDDLTAWASASRARSRP